MCGKVEPKPQVIEGAGVLNSELADIERAARLEREQAWLDQAANAKRKQTLLDRAAKGIDLRKEFLPAEAIE